LKTIADPLRWAFSQMRSGRERLGQERPGQEKPGQERLGQERPGHGPFRRRMRKGEQVNQRKIQLEAGGHDRRYCPVLIPDSGSEGDGELVGMGTGVRLPCQSDSRSLWFLVPELARGKGLSLELTHGGEAEEDSEKTKGVVLREPEGRLEFSQNGEPVTVYHYGGNLIRPFFHPVYGPGGERMTRDWPIEERSGEDRDHSHHTSFWIAHGDVNGSDHWGEKGAGKQVHEGFEWVGGGAVFGGFIERLRWDSAAGDTLLSERRTVRIWNTPLSLRLIDVEVMFTASEGNVIFGDTKEGGLCSLRVAEDLKEARGGTILNAQGSVGEAECWGKRSAWVDCFGGLNGKQVGLAIMDHPLNPLHPTYWHVRAYGLFTANPFGLSYYKSSYEKNGDWSLPSGEAATFRYRVVLHAGDTAESGIRDRYLDWIHPPLASFTE
jgi:hypothetical protein